MDKCLHDLVENYAEITFKLRGKAQRMRRTKLAAALRGAAHFGRRGCRIFPIILASFRRKFQPNRARICPATVMFAKKTAVTKTRVSFPPLGGFTSSAWSKASSRTS